MRFLGLARKNAWRKPLRTVLLIFCISVAFLIYGLTASFTNGSQGSAGASENILGVMNAAGRNQSLPMAYMWRIASVPAVSSVAYVARLRGFVGTEKNVIAVSAVEPQLLAEVNGKQLAVTPDLVKALSVSRDRVLVGRALMEAQGWTVGQRLTLTSFQTAAKDGTRDWRFEIAGVFDGETESADTYFIIARYDYINALRERNADTVDVFIVRPRADISSSELAVRIDALFANSAVPTRTQSEKQFLEAFLRQYADIGLIINLVVGAAFATLLMIVINTMVFAVRERRFEIGVLKTLGFSRRRILGLVLSETMLIFVIGGFVGLFLAKLASIAAGPVLGLVFTAAVLAKAVCLIVLLGVATGLLPAINAMRAPVTKALRAR
ncbi:ABC transporter permease [Rhizobium sp. BR 314]|uniref:ABC transporter permease n=1 Tax=Rhizobium sp. BR 314 TaxID=3040013 RepID=UPI0039BF8B2B